MTRSAASFNSTRPTSVDPVKDKFTTLGSFKIFAIAGPVGDGKIKLTTPAGTPARSKISIIASAVRGVSPAG